MIFSQDPTKEFRAAPAQVPTPAPGETLASAHPAAGDCTRLGRFQILARVGQGGMGVVYKAVDPLLDRVVALKTIRSGLLASSEEIERFFNEARAIAQFRHPHLVSLFEIGEEQGQYFFAQEFVGGGTLAERLATFAGVPRRAASVMEKIARAVHYAHERKVLHRDLKPSNILVDEADEPRVSDFGLVKFLDADHDMTQPGQMVGTLPYMSPEQASGHGADLAPASDIWSLGVMLFELVTGQRPFASKNPTDLQRCISSTAPRRPRKLRAEIDADLETIVLKCLEKAPADRYASAEALADDLARWLAGKPIQARPLSWAARAMRSLRRRPLRWLAGMAALVGLAAALFFLQPADPLRPVRQMQATLQQGSSVVVIAESGAPPYHQILLGDGRSKAGVTEDGLFTVSTWEACLVELLPDPGIDRYRFKVEVLHSQAQHDAPVGIFWGHHRQPTEKGWATIFCSLAYSDRFDAPKKFAELAKKFGQKPPEGNAVQMKVRIIEEPGLGSVSTLFSAKAALFPPPAEREKRWRRLAVEVTPEACRTAWEGAASEAASLKFINEKSARSLATQIKLAALPGYLQAVAPRVQPRQPLGLVLFQGAAKFRNAVVEPLPQP